MTNPVLVFDDACGFCTWWAAVIETHSPITVVGLTELTDPQRNRLPEGYDQCVHLLTDKQVYSCGEAVEAALLRLDGVPTGLRRPGLIRRGRPYQWLREHLYRWVASNRGLLGRIVSRPPPAGDSDRSQ